MTKPSPLYTSVTRLKDAMANGRPAPMTPLGPDALDVLDDRFTIGMGALTQDPVAGLQCPVRGCGTFHHDLGAHLREAHEDVGGEPRLRDLLELPRYVALLSDAEYERRGLLRTATKPTQRKAKPRGQRGGAKRAPSKRRTTVPTFDPREFAERIVREAKEAGQRWALNVSTMHERNKRNVCEAQLSARLIEMHTTLGREPSLRDASSLASRGWVRAVLDVYGEWENAVAQCGLGAYNKHRKLDVPDVLVGLRAFHERHRRLPTPQEAAVPRVAPMLPSVKQILGAFGTTSWLEAMRRTAALLNIYGGKYGLPESTRPKAESAA